MIERTERKFVMTEFKADLSKRQIEGYASVFGNVDGNDDIVLKGAYTRTLSDDLPSGRIKVKRNHQFLIGKPIHAEQDTKGLLTVSQISDTDLGNETLCLVQDGVIDEMSIGFRTREKEFKMLDGKRVREIKAAQLTEWSFMDDPAANPLAKPIAVKSLADAEEALDEAIRTVSALRAFPALTDDVSQRLDTIAAEIKALRAPVDHDGLTPDDAAAVSALLADVRSFLSPSVRS